MLRLLALGLGAAAGCAPAPRDPAPPPALPAPDIRGARALDEVRAFVALGSREAGTPGAERAAAYLVRRLGELGLEAEVDEFLDPTPDGPAVFRNVTAAIPGRGPGWVLLLSHYDTKSGMPDSFEGANDSGSSTGLLLEMARAVRALGQPPAASLLVGFLDGEECRKSYGPADGLHGSRRLARRLREQEPGLAARVRAVIVLDMVGDRDLTLTLPRNATPPLLAAVLAAAEAEGVRDRFRLHAGDMLDDHVPFLAAGFPAVNIMDFEYGSGPGRNDYWHTAQDALDKLASESLAIVGRVTWRVIRGVAP